ncbi:zinc knuckle, partial [Ostertagia ostertagi]
QSTPQSTRVSPVQPRGTASSRPQSSRPQGQRGARGSSPFEDPLLNMSWAQQVQAEAARLTAEASKKEKKEQKKQESESSSGVEKQSVEKEKKKPQEEEMDTSEVVQEGSALQHDVNPSDWEPNTANTGESNKPTTQLEITYDEMATAGASMMKKKEGEGEGSSEEEGEDGSQEYSRRRPFYTEPGGPLRVNPAPTSLMKKPNVTPHSTINVEPYTVEELTAHQFRTVFDYITTNNILRDRIRGIRIPDRETTPARPSDYEGIHVLQTLLEIVQHTTQSFHNLAVILVRHQPLEIRYTHLMGWIHELTHSITSITVNRDQLQEIMLPRLFQWSQDLDYFRATLQLFGITEETFTEIPSSLCAPPRLDNSPTLARGPVTTPQERAQGNVVWEGESREVEPPTSRPRRRPERRSVSRSSTRRPAERAPTQHRSRSRFMTRSVPSESHGRVEPCVFCLKEGHYSSDCDAYPYLSDRAHLASRDGMCSNCLKSHYGICIRKDPCSICHQEGHHRAFCTQNPFAVFDLDLTPEAFYDDLQFRPIVLPLVVRVRVSTGHHTRTPSKLDDETKSREEESANLFGAADMV